LQLIKVLCTFIRPVNDMPDARSMPKARQKFDFYYFPLALRRRVSIFEHGLLKGDKNMAERK